LQKHQPGGKVAATVFRGDERIALPLPTQQNNL
jgi:hypothetical protein